MKEVEFTSLSVGDFFIYDYILYIKTDNYFDPSDVSFNVMRMNPIARVHLFEDDLVLLPSEVIFYQ
jgi:hypothetical protein